jgi:multidrug efflux pump subunit AcrA (membrane-fusion protein)
MSLNQSPQVKLLDTSKDSSPANVQNPVQHTAQMEQKKPVPYSQLAIPLQVRFAIATVILLGLGFVLGQKFSTQQTTEAKPVDSQQTNILPVKTIAIEAVQSYSTSQSYTGEVAALRTSEVGFERGGKLTQVLVEEGDRISLDTPLAKLDTANLEAQRQGLIAQKAQASAILAELSNGARREKITAAQARVRDIEQQLKLEQLKSSRREYLYGEGAIAREELDEIAFNQKALAERLVNAQSNLAELNNGTRVEQINAQQAEVDRLSAEIADLDITIAKSTLKSPFDGIVAARNLDEGTVIQAGQSILRLVENAQPKVKVGVPILVASRMQPGSEQQVTIGDQKYRATVSSILPEVNPATRTRTVVLMVNPTAATQVSPKQIARLNITQTQETNGYWLPMTALVKGDRGLWSCYAVIADKLYPSRVERRLIEVLETDGERVLVRGTLKAGDAIVTDGTQRLVPNQLVSLSEGNK